MNGSNQEIVAQDNLQKSGFSPEDSCPNRYSDSGSCPLEPWNPYGTNILLESWSFPIFVIHDQTTINEIQDVRIIYLFFTKYYTCVKYYLKYFQCIFG